MVEKEYERVHARIAENEKRRYQTFAICLAGFAGVVGFGDSIDGSYLIPPGLTAVFVLCSREYMTQSVLQRINTAFLVEKFESKSPDLNYATMDVSTSLLGGRR